ncbi:hypothetical protein ACIBQ6_06985 [Nonomuraea sp. NPDC049655]|uniref:hypothetical protein n=1 Tax=Nonomuraea sp. NPDC049655 TaxID=3364355 RepID=UPI00379FC086
MDGIPRALDRRQVLRGALLAGGTVITAAACGGGPSPAPTSAAEPASQPVSAPPSAAAGRTVLLVYFSRPGENYHYGGGRTLQSPADVAKTLDQAVGRGSQARPTGGTVDACRDRVRGEDARFSTPGLAATRPDHLGGPLCLHLAVELNACEAFSVGRRQMADGEVLQGMTERVRRSHGKSVGIRPGPTARRPDQEM